ncbi:MAG: hypothetical protein SGI97_10335 [candidate division Zixibacteria bacterium]|nr:hypothetical protein [candidate division Zixibacteria bacterium]
MAEAENKKPQPPARISEDDRFHYIGFEVFPGKPKDLFSSDADKKKYVDSVHAKHEAGELIRENCTLLEERVSRFEKIILTIASLAIIFSLFIPWYSLYQETIEEVPIPTSASTDTAGGGEFSQSPDEEVITSQMMRKKVSRNYETMTGIGALADIGNTGSRVFSAGFPLMITGVILILYTISCIAVPLYVIYGVNAVKGAPDTVALKLKGILRVAWYPILLLFAAMILSFVGAQYGFDATQFFSSLGKSYGPGAFLGSLSWGILLSLAGFLIISVKGIEI